MSCASISGPFGIVQMVAAPDRLRLDIQSGRMSVEGEYQQQHVVLDLSMHSAERLRRMLTLQLRKAKLRGAR